MNSKKSNANSENLRSEANRLYVQRHFYDALLKYNESLCFAEAESENVGLAYANRSAVYLEMKLYDKCLQNIEMAKQNRYPEKNLEILKKREKKCLELMKQNNETKSSDLWDYFKLSHPPHKSLPFIADCLELRNDKKYGRHIVTNHQLKIGDIIAIDEPTFKVIKADSRYSTCFESNAFQRCANCLQDHLLSLAPCPLCCKTMYCSEDCMKSARRYHQYECEIIDELLASGNVHIVVRMFLEGLALFDDDIQQMEKCLRKHDEPMTIYDFEFGQLNDREAQRQRFLATVSLASNAGRSDLKDFEKIFRSSEKMRNLWKFDESFTRKLLSKLLEVGTLFVHGIGAWTLKLNEIADDPKPPSFYQQLVGNASYLFCSLLNSSCAPNVKRLNVEDKVVVIVCRQIEKGGQLFDSYRPNFNNQAKAQRQEALLKDYGFVCDCEACTNDWPMNADLKVYSEELLEFAWAAHEELPFLTQDEAKEMLKKCYDMIAQHQQQFPSAEIIVLQECVSNCLIAITKPPFQFP